jgi:hypothetical protein
MSRNLLAAAVLFSISAPVLAEEHHEFAATRLARLTVLETRADQAIVEGEEGEVVLVRLNDRLGQEAATVEKISHGCVYLTADGGHFSLCVEAPPTPRS